MNGAPKPALSVVVPLYQSEATIGETLSCLAGQTLADIEVIVVDDGSSDGGPTIARGFADADGRFRVVRQENRGLSGARNTGIREARSDLIGFCDADDLWAADKARLHVDHLAANPTIGLSFSGSYVVCDDISDGQPLGGFDGEVTPAQMFTCNWVGNGSAAVLRRECLNAAAMAAPSGGTFWFDEGMRRCEDLDLWMRVLLSTDWAAGGIPAHLVGYRVTAGSLSSNLAPQEKAWRAVRDRIAAIDPDLAVRHGPVAEANMLGWLGRKALITHDAGEALARLARATWSHPARILEHPSRHTMEIVAAAALCLVPRGARSGTLRRGMVAYKMVRQRRIRPLAARRLEG